jgi:hypothetical protein
MSDLLGYVSLLTIFVFGIVLVLYNRRQAMALAEMAGALSDAYLLELKARRIACRREVQVAEPLAWLGERAGLKLKRVERILESPQAIELLSESGTRLVVSTLAPSALHRALKPLAARGRVSNLVEPLLGRSPRRVEAQEHSLLDSGEYFDLEASQVGAALGIPWGEATRLWFYYVRPAQGGSA